jgi:acyl-CoA thioesterase
MESLERARQLFKGDHYAEEMAGAVIDSAEKGHAVCSMTLDERHLNAADMVMGGAIFTLADFAFAVATNLDGGLTVAQTSQITFLNRTKGKRLTAEAEAIKTGRSTCFYVVKVWDDLGTDIAVMTVTGNRVRNGKTELQTGVVL